MIQILRKLLFLMLLGSGAAQAVPKVFQHCNYGGYGVELPVGKYNFDALASRGIRNDDLSSLKVDRGYIVTLYEHNDFKGRSIVKNGSDSCLVDDGFNDKVTSIIVTRAPNTGTSVPSTEQECRDRVQGKVAWNRRKNTQWTNDALKRMCSDVKNLDTYIDCFRTRVMIHDERDRAIDQCNGTIRQPQSIEEDCYDVIQNDIQWIRNGTKKWQPTNLRRLCKNVTNIRERLLCYSNRLDVHNQSQKAIDECTGTTRPQKTKEQQCHERLQGKVAWNRQGYSRWTLRGMERLCKDVTNIDQRIQCFQNQITAHNNPDDAIEHCIRSERPLVQVKIKPPPLRQAAASFRWGGFRPVISSDFEFDWSKKPKSADCGTHATLHDGNNFALFCPKRGSSDTLYQFVYNPKTQKFEHRLRGFAPQVPIKGIPRDASPKLFAMLHDGRNHRLYMMNSQRNSLHQFVYKRQNRKGRFEYERKVKIVGTPKDAVPARFAMLHDGTNYRLYMRSRTSEGKLYVFGYNQSEQAYKYSGRSVKVRNMKINDFSMLHNGDEYFLFTF